MREQGLEGRRERRKRQTLEDPLGSLFVQSVLIRLVLLAFRREVVRGGAVTGRVGLLRRSKCFGLRKRKESGSNSRYGGEGEKRNRKTHHQVSLVNGLVP